MTAALAAAQMAVEAANNQKSRCELPVDCVGLCEQFLLAELLVSAYCMCACVGACYSNAENIFKKAKNKSKGRNDFY